MTRYFHALLALGTLVYAGRAAEPAIDFNRDIRPILSNNCYACHGPDEKERKAKLRLDTRDGAVGKPGEGAIVPGKPTDSELVKRIITLESDELMPPPKSGKKLTAKEKELLTAWVQQGAQYATHWSYVKPVRAPLPAPAIAGATVRTPVDAFIFDRLLKEKLKPAPEADRYTLIRRVALDLTGLPPTVKEVDAFVNDQAANAYERMVDRFLAKPAFGEHWARVWLDLARYADSAGYADDPSRTIWGYRDYVIRSLNKNKPFDQFTIEQIAGDMLPNPTEEQMVATAFHRNTMTNNEGGTNDEEFRNVAIVDRVNTTLAVWMGTSMACAQCHTHKYDPITQKEYFRFFAFLNNTQDADRRDESPVYPIFTEEQRKQVAAWDAELLALQAKAKTPPAAVLARQAAWEAAFPKQVAWQATKPSVLSWGDRTATVADDGSVLIPRPAKQDTYTVELPLTGGQLTAVRLEALPHDSLPGKGPGLAAGNFVISQISATITPPAGSGRKGRYLRVDLPGKNRHLMLAEVQAFAGKENVALKGIAKQSSTDFDGPASLAIDGNTDGRYHEAKSTSHTKSEDSPWWEVDLKSDQVVERIVLWNRTDSGPSRLLSNYKVSLLDADRNVVWEEATASHPSPSREYKLDGSRVVAFTSAVADYSQPEFEASSLIANPPPRQVGWGIGGATGKPHTLMLTPAAPLQVVPGSKLVLTLAQTSNQAEHVLGHFRLSYATTPGALEFARTPADVVAILAIEAAKRTPEQKSRVASHFASLSPEKNADSERIAAIQKLLAGVKPATSVPVFRELPENKRRVTKLQFRGNFLDLGEVQTEGVPAAFHPLPKDAPVNRLGMAKWLVHEDNPLTARVTVNRLWEQLFGTGLVRTSEEFGSQGELPSHPELLDWLAVEFMKPTFHAGDDEKAVAWDVKHILRLMVLSSAYRQSSKVTPELAERDPDNRLLARGPRHRLSAEMIRDQALAVSGLLSDKMYGPSVRPLRPSAGLSAAFGGGLDWQTSAGEDRHRRGIYTEWRRTSPYPSMATFDAPSREACTIRRSRSNTPLQALVTLNDPVYVEAAQALARTMAAAGKTNEEKVTAGFRACLSRPPTEKELARLVKLYQDAKSTFEKDPPKSLTLATQPIGPLPAGATADDLAAWTVVGNVLLNLDELLMRR